MAENGAAARIRVFFALWPDKAVAGALDRAAREAHACCGGRVMRREGLHMTLAFLGDIPRTRLPVLSAVADELCPPALTLTLDRCGYWRHNRIVWLGPQTAPDPLCDFALCLADALRGAGFELERRAFAPHVTLLRNARCDGSPPQPQPIAWELRGFALVASVPTPAGSRYEVIGDWPART